MLLKKIFYLSRVPNVSSKRFRSFNRAMEFKTTKAKLIAAAKLNKMQAKYGLSSSILGLIVISGMGYVIYNQFDHSVGNPYASGDEY